ncbi:MAG: PEP-CTERM sorting domain-containing protein [Microcystis sp. M038S2]|uniref:PEP-CTERM sorting domain-containing protein n=1 Tax=unclassified Microcystis TaxID=2643300 RepID=UPI00258EC87A|nr:MULTISPECIES: PEP-CTERM sorting domain-containing protein [unclassified Microcystis]MCA2682482.1 PEP-CTERM sorting domain-containing protein [Microcystis sp. M046S2]MCA2704009.1 PEP-CTERM sorting domain-containing protein [Microcystis sp. M038S2]MCA2948490.1 PEP-CTERM sorting domain-containing protein [Microcystis sp. M109S1]MCA2954108.1 PEP-CTERM sorting domain-containing protein [Microcystis sp. M112S1]
MKNSISAAILGAAVTTALIGLSTSPAQAAQLSFRFVFSTFPGDDLYDLNLTTEDTLTTINAPSYTDPTSLLTSPAYTFTGYKILGVTGTENVTNPIIGILPAGSGVFNAPVPPPEGDGVTPVIDLIPHSPSDNLYNPDGGFAPGVLPPGNTAGKFSFGGLVFQVQEGTEIELYQVFTRSDFGIDFPLGLPAGYYYGGCPGSCVGAIQVPEPTSTAGLLAIGSFGALGAASTLKRKLKSSKSEEN